MTYMPLPPESAKKSSLATKQCKSCGGENDIIISNCKFCNASLPRVELDEIPEEKLLNNCAYWLAQLEALTDPATYSMAKQAEDMKRHPMGGIMKAMSDKSALSLSDVIGNADKYIRSLHVRANTSLELAPQIREFQERQVAALAAIDQNRKKSKYTKTIFIISVSAAIPLLFLLVYIFVFLPASKREAAEENRLQGLVVKAEAALTAGNKDMAQFYCAQIKWEVSNVDHKIDAGKAKVWDEKREALLKLLAK